MFKKNKILFFCTITILFTTCMTTNKIPDNGQSKTTYTVDFGSRQQFFYDLQTDQPTTGVYAAGDTVALYMPFVATDTRYTFIFDGREINAADYSHEKGYIFRFVMPDHNTTFEIKSKNLMIEE